VYSQSLINAWSQDSRQVVAKITINNQVYFPDDILDLSIEQGAMNGDSLGVGSTFSNSAEFTLVGLHSHIQQLNRVIVELGIRYLERRQVSTLLAPIELRRERRLENNGNLIDVLDVGTQIIVLETVGVWRYVQVVYGVNANIPSPLIEGWINLPQFPTAVAQDVSLIGFVKMGEFRVSERIELDRNANRTNIECLDDMILMGGTFVSPQANINLRMFAVQIAEQAGVAYNRANFDSLPTPQIIVPRDRTHRDVIGYLAQFVGGYATFNRNGELEIRQLAESNFMITPNEYLQGGFERNDIRFNVGGITSQVRQEGRGTLYFEVGEETGGQIVLDNPSMTQNLLNGIWDRLRHLEYYPFSLTWRGNPTVEVGQWVTITDRDNQHYRAPMLSHRISYNGGLRYETTADTTPVARDVVWRRIDHNRDGLQGVSIIDTVTRFHQTSSPNPPNEPVGTLPVEGAWSQETAPPPIEGHFIHILTRILFSDDRYTQSIHTVRSGVSGNNGEDGARGEDGERGADGVSIVDTIVRFIQNNQPLPPALPQGALPNINNNVNNINWSRSIAPPPIDGHYIHVLTRIVKSDNSFDQSVYTIRNGYDGKDGNDGRDGYDGEDGERGDDGNDGISITDTITRFFQSANSNPPAEPNINQPLPSTGTWALSVAPPPVLGHFMHVLTRVVFSTGTPRQFIYSTRSGVNGNDGEDGEDGERGDDGISVVDVVTRFTQTSAETPPNPIPPTNTALPPVNNTANAPLWARDVSPSPIAGWFIHVLTRVVMSNGSATQSIYTVRNGSNGSNGNNGNDGADGTGIRDTQTHYHIHNNGNTPPANNSSDWVTTVPPISEGQWLWTRTTIVLDNDQITHHFSVSRNGVNGRDGTSVSIRGSFDTVEQLRQAHPTGQIGDAWIIAPNLWVWSPTGNNWINAGVIQGERGENGSNGTNGVSITGVQVRYVQNNNATHPNLPAVGNPLPTVNNNGTANWVRDIAPPAQEGTYLHILTRVNFSVGNPTQSVYTVRNGADGERGEVGAQGNPGVGTTNIFTRFTQNTSATPPALPAVTANLPAVNNNGTANWVRDVAPPPVAGEFLHILTRTVLTNGTNIQSVYSTRSGANGNHGNNGEQGWSQSRDISYLTDNTATPPLATANGWNATPTQPTATNRFLWVRTVTTNTGHGAPANPTPTVHLGGSFGQQGNQGDVGVQGWSQSQAFAYQLNNTGNAPAHNSGTWSNTPLVPTATNRFLWVRTTRTNTGHGAPANPTPTVHLGGSFGQQGNQGNPGTNGVGIRDVFTRFTQNTSATPPNAPTALALPTVNNSGTGNWVRDVAPQPVQGQFLHILTRIVRTDDTWSDSIYTTRHAIDGSNGSNGSNGNDGAGFEVVSPPNIAGLTAWASHNSISVQWTNNSPTMRYQAQVRATNNGTWVDVFTGNATRFVHQDIPVNSTRWYRVRAINVVGTVGNWSTADNTNGGANATTAPLATQHIPSITSDMITTDFFQALVINGAIMNAGQIHGSVIEANSLTLNSFAQKDSTNHFEITRQTIGNFFTVHEVAGNSNNPWFQVVNVRRDMNPPTQPWIRVSAGQQFRISGEVQTNVQANLDTTGTARGFVSVVLGVRYRNLSGEINNWSGVTAPANSTTAVTGTITVPNNVVEAQFELRTSGWGTHTGHIRVRNVEVRRMADASLIVQGGITSEHLTTGELRIRNYLFDGTRIMTTTDSDIILSRGTGDNATRDRLIINANYMELRTERDGTVDEDSDTSGGAQPTGRSFIGNTRFYANRLQFNNFGNGNSLINAIIQPARRVNPPVDGRVQTGLGGLRSVFGWAGNRQMFAPVRGRQLIATNQTFNANRTSETRRVSRVLLPELSFSTTDANVPLTVYNSSGDIRDFRARRVIAQDFRNSVGTEVIRIGDHNPQIRTTWLDITTGISTLGTNDLLIRRGGSEINRIGIEASTLNLRGGNPANNNPVWTTNQVAVALISTRMHGANQIHGGVHAQLDVGTAGGGAGNGPNGGNAYANNGYLRLLRTNCIQQRVSSATTNLVRINGTGTALNGLMRSSSSERYKINIQPIRDRSYCTKILELEPVTFYDRMSTEIYADRITMYTDSRTRTLDKAGLEKQLRDDDIAQIKRHGGLIAEKVDEVGLHEFVEYNEETGECEGIAYPTLWTLLIPIVKEHEDKVKSLEERLAKLEKELAER